MHIGMRLEKARIRKGLSRRDVLTQLKLRQIIVPQTFLRDLETSGKSRHLAEALPELCQIYNITISSAFCKKESFDQIMLVAEQIKDLAEKIIKETI